MTFEPALYGFICELLVIAWGQDIPNRRIKKRFESNWEEWIA